MLEQRILGSAFLRQVFRVAACASCACASFKRTKADQLYFVALLSAPLRLLPKSCSLRFPRLFSSDRTSQATAAMMSICSFKKAPFQKAVWCVGKEKYQICYFVSLVTYSCHSQNEHFRYFQGRSSCFGFVPQSIHLFKVLCSWRFPLFAQASLRCVQSADGT